MSNYKPIIIIEDDEDDKEIFELITREIGVRNRIEWFRDTKTAYTFLKNTHSEVFLIFCDINIPMGSGLEFKKRIDEDPITRKKCVPFIFYSNAARQQDIDHAFTDLTVQGFFQKGHSYEMEKIVLKSIFDYWRYCKHPNTLMDTPRIQLV